jgi:hypothetical protein
LVARYKSSLAALIIGSAILLFSVAFTGFLGEEGTENHVVIEVEYGQNWNATIQINALTRLTTPSEPSTEAWRGFGKMTKHLVKMENEEWNLTVSACKEDASFGHMYVRIKLEDGKILKSASTNDPFGKVKISMLIP